MLHASRRARRLFLLALGCLCATASVSAQTPALTTVSDTVFRADGSPASGTLLISWPAFTTADGHAVAAGIYISGTDTTEAALVTGGTCSGNGHSGTLQFTTSNPHPAGDT